MNRILVADDKEENLYLLRSLLENHGYEVVCAVNGVEALDMARQFPPDLIVSDILMPVMDGFTLCRELKKDARLRAVPVVFYTATYTDSRDRDFALSLGAVRFIVKPEEPIVFLKTVQEVIEEVQSRPETPVCEPSPPEHPEEPEAPEEEEAIFLRQYNEALVRKLETKMEELEQSNRDLVQDIRARQEAEAALQKSERFVRTILDSLSSHIAILDETGVIVFANRVWREGEKESASVLGTVGEGANYLEACDRTRGENASVGRAFAEGIRAVIDGRQQIFELEYAGRERWYVGRVTCFLGDGLLYVVVTHEDITGRKAAEKALQKSEQKYRRLYDSMNDAFVTTDIAGTLLEFNTAYRDMLGYSENELRGMTYRDLTPEKWHGFESRIIEEQILKRGYSSVYEKEYRRRDGAVLPVELRTFLIRDDAGAPVGMWAIVRDITDRKRAEKKIRDQLDELLRWQNVMMDREDRVQELKREVNALCRRLGEPIRYPSQGETPEEDPPRQDAG